VDKWIRDMNGHGDMVIKMLQVITMFKKLLKVERDGLRWPEV